MSSFCSKASLILRRKMAEIQPLLNDYQQENDEELQQQQQPIIVVHNNNNNNNINVSNRRIASLDVFRGLSIFILGSNVVLFTGSFCSCLFHVHWSLTLKGSVVWVLKEPGDVKWTVNSWFAVFFFQLMVLVDYAGSSLPAISHAPWNGLHLADFVMPMFLFAAGVSLAIVYKNQKVQNRYESTWKALVRAAKLFLLGVFLQGGYLHGITSLTYGVDVETIRVLGILQRIAIGYLVAAVCEIWLPRQTWRKEAFLRNYIWHWCAVLFLCTIYIGLTYGLYVADWQFKDLNSLSSLISENGTAIHTVKCSVRGDLGPACNAAGMIDRYALGIDHLYQKSVYRNLKECNISKGGQVPESSPSWCHASFEPEGILSSLTASVACIIGLQYGHILSEIQGHKDRLYNWCLMSFLFLVLGSVLALAGIPLNKSLYTISYMLVTSAASGITFCALYLLVDVYGWRHVIFALEWMGKHSLSIFILVASNLFVIALQGFYWKSPHNNIIYWIVSHVVQK